MRTTSLLFFFLGGLSCAGVSFQRAQRFSLGDLSPDTTLVADLNQDGFLDLIVGGCAVSLVGFCLSSRLVVLFGDGSGFSTPSLLSEGELQLEGLPPSIVVGDFNQDGLWDLVAVSSRGGLEQDKGSVTLFLGEGDGSFTLHSKIATGLGPRTIGAGDFNADSALDLIVTEAGPLAPPDWLPLSSDVLVLLGQGDGSFSTRKVSRVGPSPYLIAVRDLDQDEALDLVTLNGIFTENALHKSASVLMGEGDGTFREEQVISLGATEYRGGALGDLNDDGRLDLVLSGVLQQSNIPLNTGVVTVLVAAPNGTLQERGRFLVGQNADSVALGDVDQDGALDLLSAGCTAQVETTGGILCEGYADLFMGDGEAAFSPLGRFPLLDEYPREVFLEDANGDGWLDLWVSHNNYSSAGHSGSISVLLREAPR